MSYHPGCSPSTIYVYDVETFKIMESLKTPRLVCLSGTRRTIGGGSGPPPIGSWGDGDGWVVDRPTAIAWFAQMIAHAWSDRGVRILGHSVSYDYTVMMNEATPETRIKALQVAGRGQVTCTRVRQKTIDLGTIGHFKGTALQDLALRHLDIDLSAVKSEGSLRTQYHEFDGAPLDLWPLDALSYSREDAVLPFQIYQKQARKPLEGIVYLDGTVHDEGRQTLASIALAMVGAWGFMVDAERLHKLGEVLDVQRAPYEAQVRHWRCACGWRGELQDNGPLFPMRCEDCDSKDVQAPFVRKNGKADKKAVKEAVIRAYTALGKAVPTTDKGEVSTDKTTCGDSMSPDLSAYSEHLRLKRLREVYVDKLLRKSSDGKHPVCNWYDGLKVTGRTSSDAQQYPKSGGVRECIVPRPGHLLVGADYNSLEVRCWAQSCLTLLGTSRCAAEYLRNPDFDPHAATGAVIGGWTLDEMLARLKAKDPAAKKARQTAKIPNFGFPGGQGVESLIKWAWSTYGIRLTLKEAETLKLQWLEAWPEAQLWLDFMEKSIGKRRGARADIIQLVSGRRRANCGYTQVGNTYFQGMAGDGNIDFLCQDMLESYGAVSPPTALLGTRTIMSIHDEAIKEVYAPQWRPGMLSPRHVAAAAERMCKIMVSNMQRYCQQVPIRVDPTIATLMSKDAESTRMANGLYTVYSEAA